MSLLMQLTDVAEKGRLEPITGAVNAGEILHLVGPNGAGKSTLLARMAGMTAGEGQIMLLEHTLAEWSPVSLAHRRSYLMQQQVPPARWNARHDDSRQGLRCLPVSATIAARHASLSRQTAASVTDSLVAPARLPATNPAGGMDCTQGMATKFMRRWMILVLRSRVLSLRWVS